MFLRGVETIGAHQYDPESRTHKLKLSNKTISDSLTGKTSVLVNGLDCTSTKDVAVCVFEHELCHLLCSLLYPFERICHGLQFMSMARNLFGHTEFRHNLGAEAEKVIENRQTADSLVIGSRVRAFNDKESREGEVIRVNQKTVTIKIPGGTCRIPKSFNFESVTTALPKATVPTVTTALPTTLPKATIPTVATREIAVGDLVSTGTHFGIVLRVNVKTYTVETPDGTVLIPKSFDFTEPTPAQKQILEHRRKQIFKIGDRVIYGTKEVGIVASIKGNMIKVELSPGKSINGTAVAFSPCK